MEEKKAAAYYDELTRKGEGAARYKQGLGFSSQASDVPAKGSAIPSSSSFLSNFVRASSPGKASELQKQNQLENIQNKLHKKQISENQSRVSDARSRDGREKDVNHEPRSSRRRSSSRERERNRDRDVNHEPRRSRHRSSSRERDRDRDRDRDRRSRKRSRSSSRSRDGHSSRRRHRSSSRDRDSERKKRRSRSRSFSDEELAHRRNSREKRNRGRRSRSSSPRDRMLEKSRRDGCKDRNERKREKNSNNNGVDYSQLIEGYADMTPAERIKAKMKIQLSQTAEKDIAKGLNTAWERFEFDKDAPLDDEEIEAAEDDAILVKHVGQSFRYTAVEARREEKIKAAHDEAIFGGPSAPPPICNSKEQEEEEDAPKDRKEGVNTHLLSDKVIAKQQGSWRDRARKLQNES